MSIGKKSLLAPLVAPHLPSMRETRPFASFTSTFYKRPQNFQVPHPMRETVIFPQVPYLSSIRDLLYERDLEVSHLPSMRKTVKFF
jgi:hypothetical protein